MLENTSPARRFRKSIFSEFRRYQTSPNYDPDTAFREVIESEYEKAKSRLTNLLNEGASDSALKGERNGLFIISVGLFTFGRLDVAEDILDNIPGGRVPANHLAGVLNRLLPLPPGFSPLENPNAIKEWLQEKRSRLRWDESLERYIIENFKILPGIPSDSNPEQFSAIDNGIYREGLVVEIIPDTGINWVANFQSGLSEFSGVYQHPNRIDLIIISRGQGYIFNPETRQLLETFGGRIISVNVGLDTYVKSSYPDPYITSFFILFVDDSHLLCYDSFGFLWENTEITWNSIRGIKIKGNILIGESYTLNDASWIPFWLSIKTGQFHLGEFSIEYLLPKKPERPWWQFW